MSVLKAINQSIEGHGEANRVRPFNEAPKKVDLVIPTGSLMADWTAIGVGGIPLGSIAEVYGPESAGKTTLVLHLLANAQRLWPKKSGLFVDAEHRFDKVYAKVLGWDPDGGNAFFQQPAYAEAALDAIVAVANSGDFSLVVVDSAAALVPLKELEGESGELQVGLQARLLSQAMRRLAGAARRTGTAIVFCNQIREKIGVMWGSPETTPTGRALKFYSDLRLEVRRVETLKAGSDVPHGIRSKMKVIKNSVAPPFREALFDIRFGVGIDRFTDLVDSAILVGIFEKSGSWILLDDKKVGQGRERAASMLSSDLDLAKVVEAKTVEAFRKPPAAPPGPGKPSDV